MKSTITEIHSEYSAYDDFCMTKSGTLLGAIEIEGRDPDGLTESDFLAMAQIARSIYKNLPKKITVTEYYCPDRDTKISIAKRDNKVSNFLSKNREIFLNEKKLSNIRLVYVFEAEPDENLIKLNPMYIIKHLGKFFFSAESREIIKNQISAEKNIMVYEDELEQRARMLKTAMTDVIEKWSTIFKSKMFDLQELWAFFRFISNLNTNLQTQALKENVPDEQWDLYLSDSDRSVVQVSGITALKFHNVGFVYASIIAITRIGEDKIRAGMWVESLKKKIGCNFILMQRYQPLSKIQQTLMFTRKKQEIKRKNLDFSALFSGDTSKKQELKPVLKEKMEELEAVEEQGEAWGNIHASIVIYDQNPANVRNAAEQMYRYLTQNDFSVTTEGVDIMNAWKGILPGGKQHVLRNIKINSTQLGALNLCYKPSIGQPVVEDLRNEEAQYIFVSENMTPYYYSPFTGGRGVVIGIGPIRSGKTFTKCSMASHFMKYGGYYRAIDIDQGAETLAQFYREDGSIFRMEDGSNKGFNPFSSSQNENDMNFQMFLKNQILQMIKSNDQEELQRLELKEQQEIDEAIKATLRMKSEMQRLNTVIQHCSHDLQLKLSRWVNGGMYSHIFDNITDSIGNIDKKVAVFNLIGIKEDKTVLQLVMNEIFYRVTRLFENRAHLDVPKWLDIDEAHIWLKIDYAVDYLIRSIRTWGKWLAGVGLWTQSPEELLNIKEWHALRSAASTFFFMSDPALDESLYKKTFDITDGECAVIKNLRPKREAYIIQKDIGVSKKIIIEVEPEQYIISTSKPSEREIRDRYINEFGFEEGFHKAVNQITGGNIYEDFKN